ncbi:quinone oxidoreductase family protein [Cupriavidus gilardii]|uniref:quinone oxidoreductase family protein n=1 Tax=Cupriavidus gilardii TaxID=82541 RepID=UPI001580191E|nr:quinone oxidoreductase [Cupriavidus gilardii]MCT9071412.1 quinone oxidoreductase [Cupriavidus gilardii]QKS61503.1 quinone oxidoreductase [Cupriavidus gilardii]
MHSAAIQIQRNGGPDELQFVEVAVPPPGEGEVRIRQRAIGVNFADIYQRRGSHGPHQPTSFPVVLGSQGAGRIEAVGPGVSGLQVGQSVACFQPGAYQVVRNVPAARVVPLPPQIPEDVAGATLLRGLTAEYLLRRISPVQAGDAVLVHAAAGGMGVILCQWARALGATVIGTVGSEAKREIALAHGCHHAIDYRREDFVARTLELTDGRGVAVVYDAVGKDVFVPSLSCLRPLGMAINYGTASGDVEAFDLQLLHAKSLMVCRPTLRTFIADAASLRKGMAALTEAVAAGHVRLEVGQRFAFADAREAHRQLEARQTSGAVVLIP